MTALEEIHRNRREHEEKMKGKTWEERCQSVRAEAEAFLGRKIVVHAGDESATAIVRRQKETAEP